MPPVEGMHTTLSSKSQPKASWGTQKYHHNERNGKTYAKTLGGSDQLLWVSTAGTASSASTPTHNHCHSLWKQTSVVERLLFLFQRQARRADSESSFPVSTSTPWTIPYDLPILCAATLTIWRLPLCFKPPTYSHTHCQLITVWTMSTFLEDPSDNPLPLLHSSANCITGNCLLVPGNTF